MNVPTYKMTEALVLVRAQASGPATYSIAEAARLAGIHPELVRHYCRLGLFGAARAQPGAELVFDDDALYELRRFEHYRRDRGVSRQTLRLICELWREVERLQTELRIRREK